MDKTELADPANIKAHDLPNAIIDAISILSMIPADKMDIGDYLTLNMIYSMLHGVVVKER